MKFKIDENIPNEAVVLFTAAGHDAETVYTESLDGQPDPFMARHCREEGRILVTLDRGFGDIRAYPLGNYFGFIVLRPRVQSKPGVLDLLKRTIPFLTDAQVEHHLWIVQDNQIRIRPA